MSFRICRRMLAALAFAAIVLASANAAIADQPYIVLDRASRTVLLDNRANERWFPASLTKLMTIYVTLRAISAGEIASGSPVSVSALAASQPPSRLGLKPGAKLRMDAAIRILIVKSANDIAVALAESVAGSVPLFVERMNAEAARLGLADTRFANPNGLHSSSQFTTARDMAVLASVLLDEFPDHAGDFAIAAIRVGEEVHYSYNLLLGRYAGAEGMKTGFVCASGYNMVAAARRDGRQLIAVVFGADSQIGRAVKAAQLLNEGFATSGGRPLAGFANETGVVGPTSTRSEMCSKEAYAQRYDPGPGDAKIDSPLLSAQAADAEPVVVALGGIDAPASEAVLTAGLVPKGRVPLPVKRPNYVRLDVDGLPWPAAVVTGRPVPLPVFRPGS